MADTVTIRRATAADARAIGAVFDAAVRDGWTYLGELARTPMFESEEWDREVADGFVAAHPADGELFLLFVHPAAAGRGVGRRPLAAAHDALRSAGCQDAFLYTHDRNERALAVYRAAGYRPDDAVHDSDFRARRSAS
jgi:GNAT superfamily N-acetyltransferase